MPVAPVGWWVAGAAAVAAVLVVLFWVRGGIPTQLPLPGTVATPPPSAPPSLTTITLPVSVRDKAIVILASDVMAKRLQALGIGNFTSSAGDDLRFTLPIPPSVERADVDAVLNTPGDVEWLDWPDGQPVPDVGSAVPSPPPSQAPASQLPTLGGGRGGARSSGAGPVGTPPPRPRGWR